MPPKRLKPPNIAAPPEVQPRANNTSADQVGAGAANDAVPSNSTAGTSKPMPPKRLDSITRPASSSGRGTKPSIMARPKFAGRRSQAARTQAEQAEAEKKAAEVEAAAEEAKKNSLDAKRYGYGGRGDRGVRGSRVGRGRGGHMGDSQRLREEPVASGPFSAGRFSAPSRRSGGGGGGGSSGGSASRTRERGGSTSNGATRHTEVESALEIGSTTSNEVLTAVKSEHGAVDTLAPSRTHIKAEDGGYISSEDEQTKEEGPKQNIDHMQLIDLTGDDPLVPVRLKRVPHKDRVVGLNTEETDDSSDVDINTTVEGKKGKQRAKDLEVTGATVRPRRPAAYSSSDSENEPHIKKEPVEDILQAQSVVSALPEALATDATVHDLQQSPPSSPEGRRRAKARVREFVDSSFQDEDDFPLPPEPKFQTEAEKEEWNRKYMDLRSVRNELGLLIPKTAQQHSTDANGDTAMSDDTPAADRIKQQQMTRERNVYLFQFPPVLPGLRPITVKTDPERNTETADADAMDVDQETSVDVAVTPANEQNTEGHGKQLNLPTGSVGKLKIHKSGKATLDWGGTSLSLGMGADATFLQDVMIAQLPEKKPKDDGVAVEPAVGMGMGLIRGKFVLTPNWDEIL